MKMSMYESRRTVLGEHILTAIFNVFQKLCINLFPLSHNALFPGCISSPPAHKFISAVVV